MPDQQSCDKKTSGSSPRLGVWGLTALLLLAAPLPVQAQQPPWPKEYQVGRFRFCADEDFPLAPQRPLLDSIPALEQDLIDLLALPPSQERLYVHLFHNKSSYQGYLKLHFPDAPSRKALFIRDGGVGMVYVYAGDDFATDLRHECTHALLNAMLPVTPLWLDEGLAEYFEVAPDERVNGNPHAKYVKWNAYFGQTPRLEDLEQLRDLSQMTRTRYRHAWAWVHFLLHGPPEAREELQAFLADIQALTPPGLLSQRLRQRLPDLDARFAEHVRNGKP